MQLRHHGPRGYGTQVHGGKTGRRGGQSLGQTALGRHTRSTLLPGLGRVSNVSVPEPSSPRGEVYAHLKVVGKTPGPTPSSVPLVGQPEVPTQGTGGVFSANSLGERCREPGAFAEGQCHLLAGGTHTRLLPDQRAQCPGSSHGAGVLSTGSNDSRLSGSWAAAEPLTTV